MTRREAPKERPRLEHVGIVVEDLERAGDAWEALLGVAPERAEAPEANFRALFFHLEGGSVELLAFDRELPGVDPRVCRPAPGGVQHVAFRVADLDGAIAAFERTGGRVLEGFPRAGFHGRIAFLEHPDLPGLVELVGG